MTPEQSRFLATRIASGDIQIVVVVFRKWPEEDGPVIALFPEVPWDSMRDHLCTSWDNHTGHGGADPWAVIKKTRPATGKQIADTVVELEKAGYRPIVRRRVTQEMHAKRRDEVCRIRRGET